MEIFDIIASLNQIPERQQKELRNKGIDDRLMRISGTKGVSYNKLLQEERVSVSRSARPKYQTS